MTGQRTPTDVSPQPRDLRFDLERHRGTHWMNGDPVATAVFNALSLTFPDGEKMFMDSVRHYRSRLTGRLAEDVRAFLAQDQWQPQQRREADLL